MTFSLTTPVTGAAQTGLTSPGYGHVSDMALESNGRQVAVTAINGTQTGVDAHSVARPFTHTFIRPKTLKGLNKPNPVTGVIASVARNTYKMITRKGVTPLAGQASQNMVVTTTIEVPAGADLADPANVRACLSMHFGCATQQSAGIGDTAVTGIV